MIWTDLALGVLAVVTFVIAAEAGHRLGKRDGKHDAREKYAAFVRSLAKSWEVEYTQLSDLEMGDSLTTTEFKYTVRAVKIAADAIEKADIL